MARTTWPIERRVYYSSATRRVSSSNSVALLSSNHHHNDELLTNLGIWHETRYICIEDKRQTTSVSITHRSYLKCFQRAECATHKKYHVGAADTCSVLTDTSTLGFVYPHALAMLIAISVADKWSGQNHLYFYGKTRLRSDHHHHHHKCPWGSWACIY